AILSIVYQLAISMQFEDHFYFHRNIPRKRTHPYRAAYPYPIVISPDLCKQFTAAIDHKRMTLELGSAIHHPQGLDHAFHLVETAEIPAHRSEDGQADLAGRQLSLLGVERFTNTPHDQRCIIADRAMTGYVQVFTVLQTRFINAHGGRSRRKPQTQGREIFFGSTHKLESLKLWDEST